MKCPHCSENFFEGWEEHLLGEDQEAHWKVRYCTCPACGRFVVQLGKYSSEVKAFIFTTVRPKVPSRVSLPTEVPPEFSDDYNEACLVLPDSPKASAALSRRCLQYLLREEAKTKAKDLSDQIQEILDSKKLPTYLGESLDAIRNIGSFAAHPLKSKSSGEIIDVEPGEAEWNLDVLDGLFDFYFVQPNRLKEKKDKLNAKLGDVGKPPMK